MIDEREGYLVSREIVHTLCEELSHTETLMQTTLWFLSLFSNFSQLTKVMDWLPCSRKSSLYFLRLNSFIFARSNHWVPWRNHAVNPESIRKMVVFTYRWGTMRVRTEEGSIDSQSLYNWPVSIVYHCWDYVDPWIVIPGSRMFRCSPVAGLC